MNQYEKMNHRKFSTFFLLSLVLLITCLSACSENKGKQWTDKGLAFGPLNQVNILMDKKLWQGRLGDSVRNVLGKAYPILLSPEPQYDLRYISPEEFKKTALINKLRVYISFVNLTGDKALIPDWLVRERGDSLFIPTDKNYTVRVEQDLWAYGQLIIYIIGRDKEALEQAFMSYATSISGKIKKFYSSYINKELYQGGKNNVLIEDIKQKLGVVLSLPKGYQKAIQNDSFGWYRNNKENGVYSILVAGRDFTSTDQLSKAYFKSWMNEITQLYIKGNSNGSYMRINDEDLPLIMETLQVEDTAIYVLRGIWEMTADFMGGTFVTYVYHFRGDNKLCLLEAFLLAPGQKKRNKMQKLEYIIGHARFLQ